MQFTETDASSRASEMHQLQASASERSMTDGAVYCCVWHRKLPFAAFGVFSIITSVLLAVEVGVRKWFSGAVAPYGDFEAGLFDYCYRETDSGGSYSICQALVIPWPYGTEIGTVATVARSLIITAIVVTFFQGLLYLWASRKSIDEYKRSLAAKVFRPTNVFLATFVLVATAGCVYLGVRLRRRLELEMGSIRYYTVQVSFDNDWAFRLHWAATACSFLLFVISFIAAFLSPPPCC